MLSPRSILACLLAFSALSAPTAAQSQHVPSRDALEAAMKAQSRQDLRSPDTRDAARSRQDLRSPDTRDAARNAPPVATADVTTTPVARTAQHPDRGTPWLLIGGLSALCLGGAAVLVAQRRVRVAT